MSEITTTIPSRELCILDIVEHSGVDTKIRIPEELGGGIITEPDYVLSPRQLKEADVLLFGHGSYQGPHRDDLRSLSAEKTPDFSEQAILDLSATTILYERLDVFRVLRPLVVSIESRLDLDLEITPQQAEFLDRYHVDQYRIEDYIADLESQVDDREYEREKQQSALAELAELKRRRDGDMLYQDGSKSDTYTRRAQDRRRTLVLSGAVFTPEYLRTRYGKTALCVLQRAIEPHDIKEEPEAVGCLDARTHAHEVMTTQQYSPYHAAARAVLSPGTFWSVLASRTSHLNTARPRHTTGDGVETISRSEPGEF